METATAPSRRGWARLGARRARCSPRVGGPVRGRGGRGVAPARRPAPAGARTTSWWPLAATRGDGGHGVAGRRRRGRRPRPCVPARRRRPALVPALVHRGSRRRPRGHARRRRRRPPPPPPGRSTPAGARPPPARGRRPRRSAPDPGRRPARPSGAGPGWRPAAAPPPEPRHGGRADRPRPAHRRAPPAGRARGGDGAPRRHAVGPGGPGARTRARRTRRSPREWPRWYAANREVVGADPDLLVPGQQLAPPGGPDG